MVATEVDYRTVFHCLPVPVLLLTPDFRMVDANEAFLHVSGRSREDIVGRNIIEAFPDNPSEPSATGTRNLSESLTRVLRTGEADVMALQRYDVAAPGSGVFKERYWCPVNVPVIGSDGRLVLIVHCVEEVSDLIRRFVEAQAASA
jgi:PAS domain S-box-containing protein